MKYLIKKCHNSICYTLIFVVFRDIHNRGRKSNRVIFFFIKKTKKKYIYIKCFILISNNNKRKNNDFIYF
jgi:hypothetical protein